MSKSLQIAKELLAAVGGKDNVTSNDICMTRLRILTEDPSLVDEEQLTSTSGVLGIVQRGSKGIEVVFGPGKVEGVHQALTDLTGIEDANVAFDASGHAAGPMQVIVNDDDDDVDDLSALLESVPADDDAPAAEDAFVDDGPERTYSVLIINGPNINMLGIREPGIYGTENYAELLRQCKVAALDAGFAKCSCLQSNHEGDLVDFIQDAYGIYDGIVINPGAYTHTSIAILDAAKAVSLPMVEVHISRVEEREDFRQVSYIRQACFETITGLGIQGYRKAIFDLAEKLGMPN